MDANLELKNTKDIQVEVSEFRGEKRIDIRRWYQDKNSGEWKRTQKGINMSVEEWQAFLEQIEDVKEYVNDNL